MTGDDNRRLRVPSTRIFREGEEPVTGATCDGEVGESILGQA